MESDNERFIKERNESHQVRTKIAAIQSEFMFDTNKPDGWILIDDLCCFDTGIDGMCIHHHSDGIFVVLHYVRFIQRANDNFRITPGIITDRFNKIIRKTGDATF
jgi:hypothetical protein